MKRGGYRSPRHEVLRPNKSGEDARLGDRAAFPVYPHLVDDLTRSTLGHDQTAAHVCSVAAGWAYSDAETLSVMMARLGFLDNRCRYVEIANDSMFVESSAFLVQSECGRVAVLAYRGTKPFDLSTWAADADVHPVTIPVSNSSGAAHRADSPARVHGGFYRNQRATWFDVAEGLDNAVHGRSVLIRKDGFGVVPDGVDPSKDSAPRFPLEALYVTGHSLGAAMAILAAYRLATDTSYSALERVLRGVYAFAPPMVGNGAFAEMWRRDRILHDRVHCHVFGNDVVPRLPPEPAGDFAHVGIPYHSEKRERPPGPPRFVWERQAHAVTQLESLSGLVAAAVPLVSEQLPAVERAIHALRHLPFVGSTVGYSFYDHTATYYIATSQPDGVLTEFGADF